MGKSLKILVAEHDRDVAEGLCDILDLAGHEVHPAFTVEEACERLQRHDFDVAFVNVKIEGLSRLESFAEVRKIKPDAKLIMMSAHTIDRLAAEVTDGGMVKVLGAPLDIGSVAEGLAAVGPAGTLLLEDVPADFADTLQTALQEWDTRVAIARDGDEALARLAEGGHDVLLLDLRLPVIRSLEVYLHLRRQGCSLPTILFRSYAEDRWAHNDISSNDILFKPFDPAQMVDLLKNMADTVDGAARQTESAARVPLTEAPPPFVESPPVTAAPDAGELQGTTEEILIWQEDAPPVAAPADAGEPQGTAEEILIWKEDTPPEVVTPDAGEPQGTAEEILVWKEDAPPEAACLVPAGPPSIAEPAPPSERAASLARDPVPEGAEMPQATPGLPASAVEAPAPAVEPAVAPAGAVAAGPEAAQGPGEARLPAGIGISADQLEQAASEIAQADHEAEPSATCGTAPGTGSEAVRVLVVDDDHDMAEGLAEILDDTGFAVKVAHSTEQAKAALKDFEAQIALVDIQLGRNSGLDLIGDLKQLRPGIIVVMVTAQAEQQMAIEALRKGAFDYLNKPLHPQELMAAMDRCFDDLAKRPARAAVPQTPLASSAISEAESAAYLAKLSEKLHTPLAAAAGFSETLSDEMLDASPFVDHAQGIKEAGERLADVVREFAGIDRSKGGKLELNESAVDLTRVIFRCLELVQPAADAGGLTVEIEFAEIPLFVIGDRRKLTQVMLGLLTNAVKFTPREGSIHFIQSRAEDNGLVVEIKDSGIGAADGVLAQALAPVIDGDGGLDPGYEGSGLGLPLAASMTTLHGGALMLDSEPGNGTTATLRLPPERNIAPKRFVAL